MPRHDADLIIAGAGCAGLSALWHVLRSPAADRRIVVVDRGFEPTDDRTWAFWGTADAPFAGLADRSWSDLRVRFPGWERTARLGPRHGTGAPLRYTRVRRRDYDRFILDEAAMHRNVRFVAQPILGIHDEPGGGIVRLPEGELRAPMVWQSVQLGPDDRSAHVRHPLRQHFAGVEVRTERAVFDPSVATLMDFDTPQHGATAFLYVLPEAPDRALVEHTMFSCAPRPPSFHLEQVMRHLDRVGAGTVTIERSEQGVIPMEERRHHQQSGRHIWNLGTVGGRTKPTTGYTFQRIHAQSRHLVDTWVRGGRPTSLPVAPRRYAFADQTLLSVLHRRPELGRPTFERLFRRSAMDDVLAFLDEDTTLGSDATMVSHLPFWPFTRAAAGELVAGACGALRRR